MEVQDLDQQAIVEEQEFISKALDDADEVFKILEDVDYDQTVEKLSPLDRAKYDLAVLYALNSQYWMYIRSLGKDTKSHPVMEELLRIKKITERIREMTEKAKKRPMVVDAKAAHRMVKHELWTPKNKSAKTNNDPPVEEENWDTPTSSENTSTADTTSSNT